MTRSERITMAVLVVRFHQQLLAYTLTAHVQLTCSRSTEPHLYLYTANVQVHIFISFKSSRDCTSSDTSQSPWQVLLYTLLNETLRELSRAQWKSLKLSLHLQPASVLLLRLLDIPWSSYYPLESTPHKKKHTFKLHTLCNRDSAKLSKFSKSHGICEVIPLKPIVSIDRLHPCLSCSRGVAISWG